MNKKSLKRLLITLSSIYIIIELFLEGPLNKIMNTGFEPDENIPFIIAIILLIIGIFINPNKIKEESDVKKHKLKFKILRIVGFLPFIGAICYSLFMSVFGGSSGGFIMVLIISSIIIWPLYIIGIILIIKSNEKLKEIEQINKK